MHSSKNKFYFNSAPPKGKNNVNIHDYYKSYAENNQRSSITNSEPHKPIKATSQIKLKNNEEKSQEIRFQNNRIVVRNIPNNGIFNQGKLTIKSKATSENASAELKRKNSKKFVSQSLNFEKRPSKNNFSYDANASKKNFFNSPQDHSAKLNHMTNSDPRKSKNDWKLPRIDSNNEKDKIPKISSINTVNVPENNSKLLEKEILNNNGNKSPTKINISPNHKKSDENFNQEDEMPSPIVQNRNVRVITKHSIIPFKDAKPNTEVKELKVIEENINDNKQKQSDNHEKKMNYEENKSPTYDIKKQKRLSDVGLGADEINKLISKMNAEKKKDEVEESKENKNKKMSESGIMSFSSGGNLKNNEYFGSHESSPMKQSNINNNSNVLDSPLRANKTVVNFAFKSKAGAMPGNTPKTNQDVYITIPSFANSKDRYFFGVCDGHGVNGHLVSGYIKQNLPKFIEKVFKEQNENESPQMIRNALHEGHLSTYHGLLDTNIDSNFSGSTSVTLLITTDKKIFCANVGDSRAIICKCKNSQWSAVPLSRDQKPDDPQEMQRVLKNGGRVEAFKDFMGNPVGPARVWLKHENIPGLAMARSIGDKIAAQVGVIPDPEIKEFDITEEDKFIVIASDGVWEFLSNTQVMNYVLPFYQKNQPEAACEKLIKESVICWKREDEVIDDITVVLIILNMK